jgi:glycosyltransferase involved in cell wall biosynthesis
VNGAQRFSPEPSVARSERVALVHDFLLDVRGAERVFWQLCQLWPEADIFTAVYDEAGTDGRFAERCVHSSFLQRVRPSSRNFRALLPLYPAAIESFDLSGYDLVVSSSSAWAHAVGCRPPAMHVSYCHNPFRYAWNDCEQTLARQRDPFSRALLAHAFSRWRHWDRSAAQRTNRYISNSRVTQLRVREYFKRESSIVHPPVETSRFSPAPVGDHYVIVSELMAHKRIDVAIDAFNRLRLPLVVVGDGPEAARLAHAAGPTVTLAGRLSDSEVAAVMASARALVVTAIEEFGIASLESQAAGRPVIARRGGGALETVIDGVTGGFWSGGARELAKAVLGFDDDAVAPGACIKNAARFDIASFRAAILGEVRAARAERNGVVTGVTRTGGLRPLSTRRLLARALQITSR